ncbi:MAG: type ISP restriction/modification enzyme [Alphaproteobacteria bacterium]|nr:type ISP restriction/modification enzyme [Alphaproteobacteria bacterium]
MSQLYIEKYQRQLAQLKRAGKTKNESSIRKAFLRLVENYAEGHDLTVVDEVTLSARARPDATLRSYLGLDVGYIENKDIKDDIEIEIKKKIERGYPLSNILFENSEELVFYQHEAFVAKISLDDDKALDAVLQEFVSFKRPEVAKFEKAIEAFKDDVPTVIKHLREIIDAEYKKNKDFQKKAAAFLDNCHKVISRDLTFDDVREMIIQHILTEDIFSIIFSDADFHRENNIARELSDLIQTFFKKDLKRNALDKIHHYYDTIRITATAIDDHGQKQDFLKTVYEEFYKAYSPQKADKQGIVYTPIEVVRFMIAACDHLLHEHFNKTLASKNVEILDPCTGTGVFITEILRHMEGQKKNLPDKYEHEIHCNEMDLLPYYIANLNIEYIYKQITGEYKEFPNICLVDTLDNLGFDKSADLFAFAGLSEENLERVKRQNKKKISVIIGNPPYNANQRSENDNNKNREYPAIDKRIKDTYIKESTAQKTKQYDMYKRFIRWASDRIQGDGIVAFITNNAFLEAKQDDGFRKIAAQEFSDIYIVDLGGNVRRNPKLSGTKNNVFGIQTGVCISFLIKRKQKSKCRVYYRRFDEMDTAKEKKQQLAFLTQNLNEIGYEQILPTAKNQWLNLSDNDFDDLLPLISKEVKAQALGSKVAGEANTLFKISSLGVVTNRDDWAYALDAKQLGQKMSWLIAHYNKQLETGETSQSIKWTRRVKKLMVKREKKEFLQASILPAVYRPFAKKYLYYSKDFNEEVYKNPMIYPSQDKPNRTIFFNGFNNKIWQAFSANTICDLNCLYGGAVNIPFFYYSEYGTRLDNISDWGLKQFQTHYGDTKITKEAIFHYVYAALNNPSYKEKYADNLKTEYPRIPFYDDFHQWAAWGKQLMALHIDYEKVKPYKKLKITSPVKKNDPLLKLNKEEGMVTLDAGHVISGIPPKAFDYKLGSRSPIEWVLEGYKPKKYNPDKEEHHKILAAEFNHYDWQTIRAKLLDLIPRLVTVSLETLEITDAMKKATAEK